MKSHLSDKIEKVLEPLMCWECLKQHDDKLKQATLALLKIFNSAVGEGMKGLKYDKDKPMWELLPLQEIEDIVVVMTYGAKKYAPNNWKQVIPKERYLAATLRHITKWQSGESLDNESKLPHLAHALCSLLFLYYLDKINHLSKQG